MWFPNNLGLPVVPHKKVEGAITLPAVLMDVKIAALTDDYIGSADKISVILCTREMKQREGERWRECFGEGSIINITNSYPWRARL